MYNTEISASLYLSPATVKSNNNKVFFKLGLRDRVHTVMLAHRLGVAD